MTAGQRYESTVAIELLEAGLERLWFDALAGDRGYSTHNVRDWLARNEIAAVIPRQGTERGPRNYDEAAYRHRNVVERTINRLKRYRRIATRSDKLRTSYQAMLTLACILEWL